MSQLHEVIEKRSEELLQRWVDSVRQHVAPGGESRSELEDHIPAFLLQLQATLRGEHARDTTSPEAGTSPVGRAHGAQRFRLGFALGELVREYGLLRDLLLNLIIEEGLQVSLEEVRLLTNFVATAIAEAVDEHARQHARAMLEEREAQGTRLATLFEQVPALVVHVSGDRHVIDLANAACRRLAGTDAVLGRPLEDVFPGEGRGPLLELLGRAYATGQTQRAHEVQLRGARPGEEEPFLDLVLQPTRDAQGQVDGVLVSATEVTRHVLARRTEERLRAEVRAHQAAWEEQVAERERLLGETERLRAQAEGERTRLNALFRQAPVAIGVARGPQVVFDVINPLLCRLWGRTSEQVVGKPLLEALPELEGQGYDALQREVMRTGVAFVAKEREVRFARGEDGALETGYFDFVYEPLRDEQGRIEGVITVAAEVTEGVLARQQAEVLLRRTQESERARAAVLDALSAQTLVAVSYLTGPRHVFETANELFRHLVGRDVVGQEAWRALPELEGQGFPAQLTRVFETGVPYLVREKPVRVEKKPGRAPCEGLFDLTYQPVRAPDGGIDGVLSLVVEVTEQVRLRREAQRLAEEERGRRDFEQHLIGIVSHDLRNPLGAILLGVQLLLRREGLDTRTVQSLVRLHASTERAVRMVHDLLDFTQARLGGGLKVQRVPGDIHGAVRAAVEELQETYPLRALRLETRGEGRGTWDADRLTQVVGNLVSNALKYSPADSTVTVRCEGEADGVRLEVHNTGEPIAPEALPRLFQPLQRAVERSDMASRSVGLGLYIVEQIVRAHGGTIQVVSTARDGTCFSVRLPREG